jgi:hypothetical protein
MTSGPLRLSMNGDSLAMAGGLSARSRYMVLGSTCQHAFLRLTRAEATGGGTLRTLGNLAYRTQLESTLVVAAVSATRMRAVMKVDLQVEKVELRAGEVIGDERQEAAYRLVHRVVASVRRASVDGTRQTLCSRQHSGFRRRCIRTGS